MKMQGIHYDLDAMFPTEPDFYADEELCLKDYEYLKRLYPKETRLVASLVEEYLDRYEFEGSPMYAEYPDAVSVFRMAGEVYHKLTPEGTEKELKQLKDMVQMMMCQEMYVRRRRHDKFCRKFQNCQRMRK